LAGGEVRRTASIPVSFTGTGGDANPGTINASLAGRALLPLALAATTLTPTAEVGTPTTSSLLLTNRSAASLTLNTLTFGGATGSDYTLGAGNTCTAGLVLAAGANCTTVIRFDPPSAGARNATLTLAHTALGSPQVVTLNGTATPAPQGQIGLSALSLTFAATQLNGSSAQSVTVQNTGNLTLTFSAFNLAGAAATDYERSGTCATASPLAIGAQCTLTITFRPTALGTRSASLTILSDASNGPATISITGTGIPIPVPVVTLAPASLDFGAQTVGNLYPTRTVRLTNSGTADLVTSSIVAEGAAFSVGGTCPTTLTPGAGCDILVSFAPIAANTDYTGTVRVTDNAAGSPHTVALTGRGTAAVLAALVWSPAVTELAFGTVTSGTVSAPQTLTLLNQGPGGVTLTVLNAVGADAAVFAVGGGTCQVGNVLFEGQSCTVNVSFAPAAAGARTASMQVASSGSFPPALALTGTGLGGPAPGLALSATALNFASTRVGSQSLPSEITLTSNGSGTLQVTAMSVDGPYTMQPKTCPAAPFSVAAGSDCTVSVSFAPQGQGAAAGTLRVTTSADATPREVPLSGEGEAAADLSSGGCSIASGETMLDPTLWMLVLAAIAVLLHRHRARRIPRRERDEP
jgi:trimeric autotransporter adhesin